MSQATDACRRPTSSTSAARSRAASRAAPTRSRLAKGEFLANAALASRKDARDAVVAARGAVKGWAGATAYNRGQVLYRIAEILEGRRAQFVDEIVRQTGSRAAAAAAEVDEAIDRWVWYAGWCDKFAQVAGNGNPVAGPYFNISVPEPTGVVAVIAPQDSALLGLVSAIAPALVTGNTVVVVASASACPLSAISLAEVLATSDVPGRSRQHPHRVAGRDRAVARLARRRPRARPRRRRRPRLGRPADRGGRHAQARAAARAGPGCRGPESRPDQRVHRDEDGLAHQEHGLNPRAETAPNFGNEKVTAHVEWSHHVDDDVVYHPEDMPDARRPP